ncbi:PREDICTED: uncharacterized protein LOC109117194 [Tarenaya hassleriana]|uniref:uncharacterized protein LOC109117194 n=2 Tax=Tarenaya hassleriana TaxID=28532 RepID=UPI0008FD59D9|nr:PREDICTED: uncharacterized protein LOC109117194 [Tarenaya hassleriana]
MTMDESSGSTQLTPQEINSLYLEVVPPDAKGRIYGIGALASQLGGGDASSSSVVRHVSLTREVEELKRKHEETSAELVAAREKIAQFDAAQAKIARLEEMMQRFMPPTDSAGSSAPSPAVNPDPSVHQDEQHPQNLDDFPDNLFR